MHNKNIGKAEKDMIFSCKIRIKSSGSKSVYVKLDDGVLYKPNCL